MLTENVLIMKQKVSGWILLNPQKEFQNKKSTSKEQNQWVFFSFERHFLAFSRLLVAFDLYCVLVALHGLMV